MSDNFVAAAVFDAYEYRMIDSNDILRFKIEFSKPIELNDFVRAFASLGVEYERYISTEHPEYKDDARVYLRRIEEGSIVAELLAYSTTLLSGMGLSTASEFGKHLGASLATVITDKFIDSDKPNSRQHLSDMKGMLDAVANDPNGSASLSLYRKVKDGTFESEEILKYDTADARKGIQNIEKAIKILDKPSRETLSQVLMVFDQVNRNVGPLDKRSGDRVTITAIDAKPKAVVYLSETVQQSIKREITEADENVMKKGYIVDVDVERLSSGSVAAYILTSIHDSFDLPEE